MTTAVKPKVKIKKGDMVVVISGKDAGKRGKVTQVLPTESRIVVEGVGRVKRHTRPSPRVMQGGIIEKEAAIHVSNVMIFCDKCKAPRRIGYKLVGGQKQRVCAKCGNSFDQ